MLKKGDILIIASVLLISAVSSAFIFTGKNTGKTVTVQENNSTVYSGSLFENKTIELEGNTVVIENGSVFISNADCKNQICVNHMPITAGGESIICLPNQVLVEIE